MRQADSLSTEENAVRLRGISLADIETLRLWKNRNRKSFFYQQDISPQEQVSWFESFQKRSLDWMFILEYQDEPVGCIGIRFLNNEWDIYNVIRGEYKAGSKGAMSWALQQILSWIRSRDSSSPIRAKVLKSNPAITWYQQQGFQEISSTDNYHLIEWQS